jgi:hypothetical protein
LLLLDPVLLLLQIGDLYYDSGDPDIGLYAMDTQGNLYNFYNDIGGERKITPVRPAVEHPAGLVVDGYSTPVNRHKSLLQSWHLRMSELGLHLYSSIPHLQSLISEEAVDVPLTTLILGCYMSFVATRL